MLASRLKRASFAGLSRCTPIQSAVLACAAGAFAALGQVPFSQIYLAMAGFALLAALLVDPPGWRRGALIGWCAGIGYFAVALHWIVEPFLVDIGRHGWMAPFALLFSATGFALFWALAGAVTGAATRPGWARLLAFPLALTLCELARGYILTGFPWALPGYVWTESGVARLAALIGPYGLTLVTLAVAALIAGAVRWRTLAGLILFVLAVLLPGAFDTFATPSAPQIAKDAPVIRLVQPNAPQREKWDPSRARVFFDRQLEFTAAPGAPDLTIWPETAIPWLAEPGLPALTLISDAANGRPVVIGAQRNEGLAAYNSLLLLGPGGVIVETYDKHHLVPLGEYIPFGELARLIGLQSFASRDGFGFSPGPGPRLVDLGPLGRALPLICYEAVFPQDMRGTERPRFLLQITNDAWFGTFAGPQQHLAQARMRAIEQGLPMLRAANTGISGVIDAQGRLLDHIPLGQAGFLDVQLPDALPPTPYARSGDLPVGVLLIVLLAGVIAGARRLGD
ncbi:apolipoprotein N-acyltransferase [Oceaniovalibus sp. ACAM 378]|uniref:apolipoprotein N-acyltransferase n=1 Tax=Oceaniovalibus sp. ACAM 378 TaxID=2599923 RepID=UPI0011DB17A8|nr:apolipoprotein N-acyltransferase [Oceaniovalibus sp. ACAM 378]TYB87140.1 apolipoprotein N-acyltransferase [Oceaniovalibus sp. ACAM 378]